MNGACRQSFRMRICLSAERLQVENLNAMTVHGDYFLLDQLLQAARDYLAYRAKPGCELRMG